jgi:hypothetical protein
MNRQSAVCNLGRCQAAMILLTGLSFWKYIVTPLLAGFFNDAET